MSDLKIKIHEFKYWHYTRKVQKIIPWIARHLPRKLKYFVVIHGMVAVAKGDNPDRVTGMDLLDHWSE